jgi:hypothetical protein
MSLRCLPVLALLLLLPLAAQAVDADRLWLPKKYRHAMMKLENTAFNAESSERCTEVTEGRIDVYKSTDQRYYFIITCRDKLRKTYNISYYYPVEGTAPELVNEQKLPEPEPELLAEQEPQVPMISGDDAWQLCLAALQKRSAGMLDVLMMEENPEPGMAPKEQYDYEIPLDAKDPRGTRLRYKGVCKVQAPDQVELKIKAR